MRSFPFQDAIEVTCEPQCIGLNRPVLVLVPLFAFVYLFVPFVMLSILAENLAAKLCSLSVVVVIVLVTAAIIFHYRGAQERNVGYIDRTSRVFLIKKKIDTRPHDAILHYIFTHRNTRSGQFPLRKTLSKSRKCVENPWKGADR